MLNENEVKKGLALSPERTIIDMGYERRSNWKLISFTPLHAQIVIYTTQHTQKQTQNMFRYEKCK